jgi:hypothetical protein
MNDSITQATKISDVIAMFSLKLRSLDRESCSILRKVLQPIGRNVPRYCIRHPRMVFGRCALRAVQTADGQRDVAGPSFMPVAQWGAASRAESPYDRRRGSVLLGVLPGKLQPVPRDGNQTERVSARRSAARPAVTQGRGIEGRVTLISNRSA